MFPTQESVSGTGTLERRGQTYAQNTLSDYTAGVEFGRGALEETAAIDPEHDRERRVAADP